MRISLRIWLSAGDINKKYLYSCFLLESKPAWLVGYEGRRDDNPVQAEVVKSGPIAIDVLLCDYDGHAHRSRPKSKRARVVQAWLLTVFLSLSEADEKLIRFGLMR